jgi:aspartate-semialdehyde dehydrogenase
VPLWPLRLGRAVGSRRRRIRADRAGENGLVLFLACDNLVKGAALNAIQIAELILDRARAAACSS